MNGQQPSDKLQVQITQIDNGFVVGIAPQFNKLSGQSNQPKAIFCNDYSEVIHHLKGVWPIVLKD